MNKTILSIIVMGCFCMNAADACAPAQPACSDGPAVQAGKNAVATVNGADATAVALGLNAKAVGGKKNAVAIALGGAEARVTSGNGSAIAVGRNAKAENLDRESGMALAIGNDSSAKSTGVESIAIGRGVHAGNSQVVIGGVAGEKKTFSGATSVGAGARVNENAVALGRDSKADGKNSISVGHGAGSSAGKAVAIGQSALAKAGNAVAVGSNSRVDEAADSGVAVGNSAGAGAEQAVALGNFAKANGERSVALGAGSHADDDLVVSVGRNNSSNAAYNFTRRIVNVTEGEDDADVVVVSQLNRVKDSVKNVRDAVDAHEGDLDDLKEELVSNNGRIEELGDAFAEVLEDNVAREKQYVRQLQASAADNQRLNDLTKAQAGIEGRLDSFDRRLDDQNKEIRRGLATQAALSGLFQPYSVGRFNVTASVGGYKSEQALAVGAGYRPTQKFAVKAGFATNLKSGGSAAYNVAVDYEF